MEQRYSLAQLTVLNTSPPEIAKIAADCGYDYVSMRQIYMGLPEEPDYDLSKNKTLMKETKRVMADTGIALLDVELARIFDGMDLEKYRPTMETAVELGGKHILSSIWTTEKDYYIERFAELCDMAAEYNLTVDLEYVPIAGVKTLAQTVEVLKAVNRDNAGLMVDMHHFHRAHDNPEDLKTLPAKWFHFAHLCDAPAEIPTDPDEFLNILRANRSYVGEGGIDLSAILNAMPQMPYSIELPRNVSSDVIGYKAHAQRCIDTAKAYFSAHPRRES